MQGFHPASNYYVRTLWELWIGFYILFHKRLLRMADHKRVRADQKMAIFDFWAAILNFRSKWHKNKTQKILAKNIDIYPPPLWVTHILIGFFINFGTKNKKNWIFDFLRKKSTYFRNQIPDSKTFFDAESENCIHFLPSGQFLAVKCTQKWPKMVILAIFGHFQVHFTAKID